MACIRKTAEGKWRAFASINGNKKSKTFASIEEANEWAKAMENTRILRNAPTQEPDPPIAA